MACQKSGIKGKCGSLSLEGCSRQRAGHQGNDPGTSDAIADAHRDIT